MASSRLHMPATARAVFDGSNLEDLERLYEELEVPGHRVELYGGRIVVNASPSEWHSRAVFRLTSQLMQVALANRWVIHTGWGLYSAATRDRTIPDLMVTPPDVAQYDTSNAYGHAVLLVTEVVSPGSVDDDLKHKPRVYAQAGVPLLLRIDPTVEPGSVALLSNPSGARYTEEVSVAASTPLHLPEPFGVSLDTEALFR